MRQARQAWPGRRVTDVQIALRERDLDAGGVQGAQDRQPQAVLRLHADVDALHPCEQAEVERAFAEAHEQRAGHGDLLHLGQVGRGSFEQAQHLRRVAAVRDTDIDLVAPRTIGQRPVHHLLRREIGVRHDHFRALPGPDRRRTHADALDLPDHAADVDLVADIDRPLDHQDQAGHEVADDVLQAEAHTHAERAGQQRHLGEVDAERGQRQHESGDHEHVADDRRDGDRHPSAQVEPGQEFMAEHEAHDLGQQPRRADHQQRREHGPQRDRQVAGRDARVGDEAPEAQQVVERRMREHEGDDAGGPTEQYDHQAQRTQHRSAMLAHAAQTLQQRRSKQSRQCAVERPCRRPEHQRKPRCGDRERGQCARQPQVAEHARTDDDRQHQQFRLDQAAQQERTPARQETRQGAAAPVVRRAAPNGNTCSASKRRADAGFISATARNSLMNTRT